MYDTPGWTYAQLKAACNRDAERISKARASSYRKLDEYEARVSAAGGVDAYYAECEAWPCVKAAGRDLKAHVCGGVNGTWGPGGSAWLAHRGVRKVSPRANGKAKSNGKVSTPLDALRTAVEASRQRDDLVRKAHADGIKVSTLVGVTGLTRQRIHQLVKTA